MKFLTAYRKLLDGEFSSIRRADWRFTEHYLYLNWQGTYLVWNTSEDAYIINEEDAFADDWEWIK